MARDEESIDGTSGSAGCTSSAPEGQEGEQKSAGTEGVWKATVAFLSEPVNIALVLWMLLAGPACITSALIKLGFLSRWIPDTDTRENVDEICVQIVNALFVLACLVGFPLLCRHVVLLVRWTPRDKLELRKTYCKNGKRKPKDRTHMSFVVFWGQLTCWGTFLFAAIYWFWPPESRPATFLLVVNIIAKIATILSFLYLLLSPLSQDFDVVRENDEAVAHMFRRTGSFFHSNRKVTDATWQGTVCPGCLEGRRVALLTCLFPCCMFGYNMHRLGFGEMTVHTLAFFIVLLGPVVVFAMSAQSLRRIWSMEEVVGLSGVLLAVCGLAYGGLWRIKMRSTFGLPGSKLCCGSEDVTDICTWMWCCCCALCQEIRTASDYDIERESFYHPADRDGRYDRLATVEEYEEGEDEVEGEPLVSKGRNGEIIQPLLAPSPSSQWQR